MQWRVWWLMGSWPPQASPGLLSFGAHCVWKKHVKWFHCSLHKYMWQSRGRQRLLVFLLKDMTFKKNFFFCTLSELQNFSCASTMTLSDIQINLCSSSTFKLSFQSKLTQVSNSLPELHHSTGEVSCVWDAIVGETAFSIPGITTTLPRQVLKKKERKKITQAVFFSWTTLPALSPILSVAVEQPSPWCSL